MTEQINCKNQSIPAYSGITINITNPTLNAAPLQEQREENPNTLYIGENQHQYRKTPYLQSPNGYYSQAEIESQRQNSEFISDKNNEKTIETITEKTKVYMENQTGSDLPANSYPQSAKNQNLTDASDNTYAQQSAQNAASEKTTADYPPEYYINNYNNQHPNSGITRPEDTARTGSEPADSMDKNMLEDKYNPASNSAIEPTIKDFDEDINTPENENPNLTTSAQIIETIDKQNEEEKQLQKTAKKTKVVALTDEYIMSLENYLNNPNVEIRLMAAKDILTRLDEDRDRYNDAALNALINKMLQDPAKLVRIAALSALSSDLAGGNDYTVELLNKIQQDPASDQQDVLEAAQIMLNRSAEKEIRYVQVKNTDNETVTETEKINKNNK